MEVRFQVDFQPQVSKKCKHTLNKHLLLAKTLQILSISFHLILITGLQEGIRGPEEVKGLGLSHTDDQ